MAKDHVKKVRASVMEIAQDPDGVADRALLKLIGDQFLTMPQGDPLRDFWSNHTLSWLHGNDGPSDLTRAANARYTATVNPNYRDENDIALDF